MPIVEFMTDACDPALIQVISFRETNRGVRRRESTRLIGGNGQTLIWRNIGRSQGVRVQYRAQRGCWLTARRVGRGLP
jgi:hypothetical protein